MSRTMKLWERNGAKTHTEKQMISENQFGFMPGDQLWKLSSHLGN